MSASYRDEDLIGLARQRSGMLISFKETPPTWCDQKEAVEFFDVLPHEPEFQIANRRLFNSGPRSTLTESSFELHRVRRVQNQHAYERYKAEREIIMDRRGAGARVSISPCLY